MINKEQIKNVVMCGREFCHDFSDSIVSASSDRLASKKFVNGTKVSLAYFYELCKKSILRHPFKSSGHCAFKCTITRGLFDKDIYNVDIVNDPSSYCTWMFIRYNEFIEINWEEIFGSQFVEGYLYRLPFIPEKELRDASKNKIISNAFEKVRRSVKKKYKEVINKTLEEMPMPDVE